MEKENLYYNKIETLVKENKKFEGYEPILNDIIEDVILHSEVILNTVKDENVINNYLQKVISTTLITVPKKLDFHKGTKAIQPAEQNTKVNNVYVDRLINSSSNKDLGFNEIKQDIESVKSSDEEYALEGNSDQDKLIDFTANDNTNNIEDSNELFNDISTVELDANNAIQELVVNTESNTEEILIEENNQCAELENNEIFDMDFEDNLNNNEKKSAETEEELVINEETEVNELDDNATKIKELNNEQNSKIDYSIFDYDTHSSNQTKTNNIELITKDLINFIRNNDEENVAEIYNQKFKQNLTVNQIASNLNIETNEVVNILNKIIMVV